MPREKSKRSATKTTPDTLHIACVKHIADLHRHNEVRSGADDAEAASRSTTNTPFHNTIRAIGKLGPDPQPSLYIEASEEERQLLREIHACASADVGDGLEQRIRKLGKIAKSRIYRGSETRGSATTTAEDGSGHPVTDEHSQSLNFEVPDVSEDHFRENREGMKYWSTKGAGWMEHRS